MKSGGWRKNKIGKMPAIFSRKNRRGQVTLFIIIAVLIIAAAFLIYSFYPQIKSSLGFQAGNPVGEIQSCIQNSIKDTVEKISLQGGSANPEFFSTFDDIKIKNLCYTAQYCALCSVQEPQLEPYIKKEIKKEIEGKAASCFDSLKNSYEKKGYSVSLDEGETRVEILPKNLVVSFNYSLTLSKGGDTENYDSFKAVLNNNLYELIAITNSILEWEATYGDTDVTMYMDLYPGLQIKKRSLSDGTKIYIITKNGDKFQFASRSLVLSPSGYC